MICFAFPWLALGPKSLFSDTGFNIQYELLSYMFKFYGMKSMIYLSPDYRETMEMKNDPAKSGIYPLYAPFQRGRLRQVDLAIDAATANKYFTAAKSPISWVYTNMDAAVPHLRAMCEDQYYRASIPIVYQPTTAGLDGHNRAVVEGMQMKMRAQAMACMSASRVIWQSQFQVDRGMSICRRYLSSSVVREIMGKYRITGTNILPLLREYQIPDDQVAKNLQTKRGKNFSVSYVGRLSTNKNVTFILDTVRTMFARYGVPVTLYSTGELVFADRSFRKLTGKKDAMSIIETQDPSGMKGREYYASKVLPSIQCMMYASKHEGFCYVPREAIYIGAPVLLPTRPWATKTFPSDYPFFYSNETEAIAHIKRIRDGKVSDKEVAAFLATRKCSRTIPFGDDVSKELHTIACEEIDKVLEEYDGFPLDRTREAFDKVVKVGKTYIWSEMLKEMLRKHEIHLKESAFQRRTISPGVFHFLFYDQIEILNPLTGEFIRTK